MFDFAISVIAVSDRNILTDDILDTSISADGNEEISVLSATEGIISGNIYNIKNVNSGKYLNVYIGTDANGANIYQYTNDGSIEQKFKLIYSSDTDSYKFYAMCSSSGTNCILSINCGSSAVSAGQNAYLYIENNPTAQRFNMVSLGSGKYRIQCKANTNLYLAAYGTSNGSSGGTSSTSAGNVYLASYADNNSQIWMFESIGTASPAAPKGYFDRVTSTDIAGWAWRSDIPDTALDMHIYVKNNSSGENKIFVTKANVYRSDLAALGYGSGYHGFLYTMNWKTFAPGTYTVTPYAIGANGNNPAVSSSPKTFTVRNCAGSIDLVSSNGISGWVWKPDAPNISIDAHIYIRNTEGESVAFYAVPANVYRSDLVNAGYGNGYHGFSKTIDWSTLPEERLRVTVYAVDNSGYHPAFYDKYYDNRKPICLLGMTDENGHDFSSWITSEVKEYCEDIGCSDFIKYIGANKGGVVEIIRKSSYSAVSTHGTSSSISWCLHPDDTENIERGALTTSDLETLSDDCFDTTRCLLLDACSTGYGGASNTNNIVNMFHSKGVWTVIGFQAETFYYYYTDTNEVIPDQGNKLWATEFTKQLSYGKTVAQAVDAALNAVIAKHGSNNLCGLDSVYIAGDSNQVVKH